MKRLSHLTLLLTLALGVSLSACKKDGETTEPGADEEKGDALTQLKAVPADIQAEIDLVLKPITDAEELMTAIETAPERLKISAPELKGMLKAAFETEVEAGAEGVDASVSVNLEALDVTAEARAEIQSMIALVKEIKAGLAATPKNAAKATANVAAHGARGVGLATKATASIQGRMTVAMGAKKQDLEQQLADVAQVQAELTGAVEDAKTTVTGIPAEAAEMGVKLAASFTGSASAGEPEAE